MQIDTCKCKNEKWIKNLKRSFENHRTPNGIQMSQVGIQLLHMTWGKMSNRSAYTSRLKCIPTHVFNVILISLVCDELIAYVQVMHAIDLINCLTPPNTKYSKLVSSSLEYKRLHSPHDNPRSSCSMCISHMCHLLNWLQKSTSQPSSSMSKADGSNFTCFYNWALYSDWMAS